MATRLSQYKLICLKEGVVVGAFDDNIGEFGTCLLPGPHKATWWEPYEIWWQREWTSIFVGFAHRKIHESVIG